MTILQLRRYQKKDADLDAVAASGLAAAWTAYTPSVAATTGTITTASATGRYLVIGKVTFVRITVTITTNGTGSVSINIGLPNTSMNNCILAGRENSLTGKMLQGITAGTTVAVVNYDGTYPAGSGSILLISGSYENT